MGTDNIAETIAIQKTANHIQQHFSLIFPMSKKIIDEFPNQSGNLSSIISNIESLGVIKPSPIDNEFLKSTDLKECLGYIQSICEQAELDINNDLTELKESVNKLDANERFSTYDFSHTLYELYKHCIGNIHAEVNLLISPKRNKPIM